MGRFVSATGQNLLATYEQFSCPPTGSFSCPLTDGDYDHEKVHREQKVHCLENVYHPTRRASIEVVHI